MLEETAQDYSFLRHGDGHPGFCPTLGYGRRLTQELCDLLPAVNDSRCLAFAMRPGAAMPPPT